jgi:hypothetical protein
MLRAATTPTTSERPTSRYASHSAAYAIARAGRGTVVRSLGHQDVDVLRQLRCDAKLLAGTSSDGTVLRER